jgi:hypothetical protein
MSCIFSYKDKSSSSFGIRTTIGISIFYLFHVSLLHLKQNTASSFHKGQRDIFLLGFVLPIVLVIDYISIFLFLFLVLSCSSIIMFLQFVGPAVWFHLFLYCTLDSILNTGWTSSFDPPLGFYSLLSFVILT